MPDTKQSIDSIQKIRRRLLERGVCDESNALFTKNKTCRSRFHVEYDQTITRIAEISCSRNECHDESHSTCLFSIFPVILVGP